MLNCIKLSSLRRFFLISSIYFINLLFINFCQSQSHRPLIIDHDAGIDDFISCTLQLLYCPERVMAITIAPADSYSMPALWVMKRLKSFLLSSDSRNLNIPTGVGVFPGINPFPSMWRDDSWKLTQLDVWGDNKVSLQSVIDDFRHDQIFSPLNVLFKALSDSSVPVDIIETGPCSNIAELLNMYPDLAKKINRIYIMGGAVYVDGNVKEEEEKCKHDGSAEWNIYNDPTAFRKVLSSGVNVTLISLDATQYTPIRSEFMKLIEDNCHMKSFQFVFQSLMKIKFLIDIGQYMFWDTLTSAVAIDPSIVTTKKVKIDVVLDGISMGKTFEDKEHGFEIDLAVWANREKFEQIVFNILSGKMTGEFKS